jgi:hypothetical protein
VLKAVKGIHYQSLLGSVMVCVFAIRPKVAEAMDFSGR